MYGDRRPSFCNSLSDQETIHQWVDVASKLQTPSGMIDRVIEIRKVPIASADSVVFGPQENFVLRHPVQVSVRPTIVRSLILHTPARFA